MIVKFVTIIVACIIMTLPSHIECLDLSCWPSPINYVEFPVTAYYSSKTISSQLLGENTVLGKNFDFDPNRRTAVIFHGFLGKAIEANMNDIRDALLLWQDMNVFVIDYSKGSNNPLVYPQAVANTKWAAGAVYDLFTRLVKMVNKPVKNWKPIHFIGYSLGVHVAGQTAARIQKGLNLTIDRITGLDPAEPCFDDVNSPLRLKKTDARFVDIIHTDGAMKKNEKFGLIDPIGHADFYVNGGSSQPGCTSSFYKDQTQQNNGKKTLKTMNHLPPKNIEELLTSAVDIVEHVVLGNGLCHHDRSVKLFIESIVRAHFSTKTSTAVQTNKCYFWGRPWHLHANEAETSQILSEKCDGSKCIEMGINAELYDPKDATYYVKTNSVLPYCAN